jgi:hypothetical protein
MAIKSHIPIKRFEAQFDFALNRLGDTLQAIDNSTEEEERPSGEDKDAQVPQTAPPLTKFRLGCIIFGLCLSLFLVVLDFV